MELHVDGLDAYAYTGGRPFDPALPTIAFVHGGGLDHTVWILQSRYVAHHGFNALALDLPGHGRSAGAPLASIEDMADWVARAIAAAGAERAAVVGHSMGSLVALETAARHPDRVDLVALVGIAVPMPVTDALIDAARADAHAAFDMVNLWGHGYRAQVGGNRAPGMWMTGTGIRLLERARPGVLHSDLAACNAYAGGLESAARVRCPALVVLGRQDVMAPARAARALAERLPRAEVVELDGAGHMLMAERPDEVLDALRGALARAPSAASETAS